MNPIVSAILPTLIQLAEHLVEAEGPVVLKMLQDQLDKLHGKYGTNVPATK